jgi:subtilisin
MRKITKCFGKPIFAAILVSLLWTIDVSASNFNLLKFPFGNQRQPVSTNRQNDFDNLIVKAGQNGTVKVIIGLRLENSKLDAEISGFAQTAQRLEIKEKQKALLDSLRNFTVINPKQFQFIPFLAMEISADALEALRNSGEIVSVKEDEVQYPALLQSIPIIGGSAFGGANGGTFGGFSGAGRTVAILDTGVDKTHPFFNNRVVSEACYSTTSATSTSFCPGGASSSTAPGSGLNCAVSIDGCNHGTHVAGIAAGGNPNISGNGVARNANIIAIQVFSRSTDCGSNPSPCTTSVASDTVMGLERVYALRTTFAIDSVNLSLGGGRYFSYCDAEQSVYKAAIDNLRTAGIATVIASGNSSYTDSVSSPACVSTGFSVGSTNDGDVLPIDFVSSFSNSAAFLNLLAPGELILSSVPGGNYDNKDGTSMAAPMVAGAWAVMKQKFPTDTATQIFTRLKYSGIQVTDSRTGLVKPRLKLDTALNTSNVDPCNSTTAISSGQTVNGALSNTDCLLPFGNRSDVYTFTGTQGQNIAITEASSAFFTYLYLFNPSGAIIGQNGNAGTSRIPAGTGFLTLPATGTYSIYATSVEGNRFGNYTLNLATNGCNFTISSSSQNFAAAGGNGSFNVTTAAGCAWTAQSSAAWLTTTSTGNGNGTVNYTVAQNPSAAQRTATITAGAQVHTVTQAGASAPNARRPVDFDGDGKTDISIFRPGAGEWWYLRSSDSGNRALQFGISNDKLVPADFTGDGKTDIAFFRPSNGFWFILRSEDFSFLSFPFGSNGDVPLVGDFDADGKADPTVFRPSTQTWYILKSTGGTAITTFGANGDKPVPADYDGDGKTDIAIYRPSNGQWWIQRSSNNSVYAFQFGISTDKPVPGDYTGDGKADSAFFRPSTGEWFILRSEDSSFYSVPFGAKGDAPSPGDYDGDGRFDTGVFRPTGSTWYVNRTTAGQLITNFGATGDQSVPNSLVP